MVGALFGDIQCIEYSRRRMFFRKRSFPLPLCTPHSWFYFNFEFRVMSFSSTVTLYVWLCYGRVFSLLFVSFFFAGSFATRIDPVRIPRFLSSWNSQESNFSGFVDNVKNNFWIFVRIFLCRVVSSGLQYISVRLANYGYHQLWAIKRKSYEGTLVELIESSGFRGWHEFNEDS